MSMTAAARLIRSTTQSYNCEGRKGRDLTTCQAFLSNNSQAQAYQQNALAMLNQRSLQIPLVQKQINSTNDPNSVAELQARLQVEAAQVSNDANRLATMRAMAESADRAAQLALKEQELKNLAITSDGTDTFVYRPYSAK
jgi:type IV secretion system protein VirB5